MPTRRFDIDWLRAITVFLLIPFHTARIFNVGEPFYAKNAELSLELGLWVIGFLWQWNMPLLFLLAGASAWFALGFRSAGRYAGERVTRLLIPLLAGMLIVVPPQAYYALLTQRTPPASVAQFLSSYFVIDFSDLSGYYGKFTPGHLWFILFLFVYSLAALPLFQFLKGETGRHWIGRLAEWAARPGAIFLFAIPLALAEVLPDIGGKNPFYYFALFVLGFVLLADERFQQAINRHSALALAGGLVTMAVRFSVFSAGIRWPAYSPGDIAFHFVGHFNTWFWVIALMGFANRWLNRNNALLRYAGEASYPFYILHQTVIVVIGYYVVQWEAGVAAKFLVINTAAILATLLGYEAVRRFNLTRWMFGLKPLTGREVPSAAVAAAGQAR